VDFGIGRCTFGVPNAKNVAVLANSFIISFKWTANVDLNIHYISNLDQVLIPQVFCT
jgi:hypothetical protein